MRLAVHAARLALAAALVTALPARAADGPMAGADDATSWSPSFGDRTRFASVKLSPKGTFLALVSVSRGMRTLEFVRVSDQKVVGRLAPGPSGMVGGFWWVNDERGVAELWAVTASQARPSNYGDLLWVKPQGAAHELVFGWRAGQQQVGSNIRRAEPERAWAHVLGTLPKDDRRVVISIRQWDDVGDRRVRLAKLDVFNGTLTELGQAPLLNASYAFDDEGNPRLAWVRGADERVKSMYRDGGEWRPLEKFPGVTPDSGPWRFVARERALEVVEPVPGGFALVSISADTGVRRTIATTKLSPPDGFLGDPTTQKAVAVRSEPDLPTWQVLAPENPLGKLLEALLEAYAPLHVDIHSVTDDRSMALIHAYSDRHPGVWAIADVATNRTTPVWKTVPVVDPEELAEMSGFHVKASDGVFIHGYVTYPLGLAAGAKAPLVVLPHGGPFGIRDRWGYDEEVQRLAAAGFAVLQVNYRGSGGYGEAYREAGYRQWGGRMIEDILDATRWAVKKGKVDAQRICTYGGSFGGYAAVQATIMAPELFRCAIGFAGVYDLTRLEKNDDIVASAMARGRVRTMTGDDESELKAVSPAFHADQITTPLLLIHGGKDTRVPLAHAEQLRDALTKLGRPPEWMVEPAEGHGFYDDDARERMYARVLAFLKKHTAAPAPAAAP